MDNTLKITAKLQLTCSGVRHDVFPGGANPLALHDKSPPWMVIETGRSAQCVMGQKRADGMSGACSTD
jgi:hypothetical protein